MTALGIKERPIDFFIAGTAISHQLSLYTPNPDDFKAMGELIEVVPL